MAFNLSEPSMTDLDWPTYTANIRENFRAIVQGDAGVFSKMWITAEPAYAVFEKSGQTAKARVIGVSDGAGNELLWLAANASTVVAGSSWNRDDTGKVAWLCGLETVSDTFKIYRAAAAANPISWSTLLTINSAGDLIPGRNIGLTDNCTVAWGVGSSAISGSSAAGSLSLSIGSAEQARVTSTGIRIGGATSPAVRLHVGAGSTGTQAEEVRIDSGSGTGGHGMLSFYRNAVNKAWFGVNGAANALCGGTALEDVVLMSVQKLNFSIDGGSSVGAFLNSSGFSIAKALFVNGGHQSITGGTVPTVGTPTSFGTSPTASIDSNSTDSAGSFTATAGSGSPSPNPGFAVTFGTAFANAPTVILSVGSKSTSGVVSMSVSSTTTGFTCTAWYANTPAAGATLQVYWMAIGH